MSSVKKEIEDTNASHYDERIPCSQAKRIIEKFGGAMNLVRALRDAGRPRDKCNVYRWTWDREKGGTGGILPTSALQDVIEAARLEGVLLTTEDLDPRISFKTVRHYASEEGFQDKRKGTLNKLKKAQNALD